MFLIATLILFLVFDWILYIVTLAMITRRSPPQEGSSAKDVQRSTFNHVFTAMLLSLLYGIGWAFGFLASSDDVSRSAYLTGQYLFSFLIFGHTVLQLFLYLLRTYACREELRRVWYVATCRAQQYEVNIENGQTQSANKYIASPESAVEAISLEESGHHGEKQPLTEEGIQPTATTTMTVGAKNQLADAVEAKTTITNKTAVEASEDEEEVPVSSL